MKTRVVLALAVLALTASVFAAPTVKLSTNSGTWPNTPYTVQIQNLSDPLWVSNGVTSNFNTFCVERNIVFYPGSSYFASIDDVVKNGSNQLTDTTKQVYAAYLNGGLADKTGNAIQYTIWESMGYSGESKSFNFNALNYDITGWQNVKVLNLWQYANLTGDVQSQLVMTSPVPAPGAILLAGIGTSLVGWLRRRKSI